MDRAGNRAGSRDSSTERGTVKEGKEDADSNRFLSLADRDPLGVSDISDAPVRVNLLRRHSLENLATAETDALKAVRSLAHADGGYRVKQMPVMGGHY